MLQRQTLSPTYWTTDFKVTSADVEFLFSIFLEEETPFTNRQLALRLIQKRISAEEDLFRKKLERGQLYQPNQSYAVGQEILFSARSFEVGRVTAERPGDNPDYGDYRVITVEFSGQPSSEFVADLKQPHELNFDLSGGVLTALFNGTPTPDPEAILAAHGEEIIEKLEARLVDEEDAVYFGGRWFLGSLLVDVGIANLHLAEALLDIAGGGPLTTADLIKDLDLPKNASDPIREFSLEVGLSGDNRFDEVGPRGRIWWYLRHLEPADVQNPPDRLTYEPIPYNADLVRGELLALEREIDDEFSDLPIPTELVTEAKLTLIYPHRRSGTLPLTSRVQALFPTASEATRIRIFLTDQQTGKEFSAWVVRDARCVFGLEAFYREHRLPIGAYVTIKATEDPAKLIIDYEARRPHSEHIRLAIPKDGKLTFDNFKRSIGAGYDELMVLGAEDVTGVDEVWKTHYKARRYSLLNLMTLLAPELQKFNPQNAVHAKTLYSAVNVLRRVPPGPIFSELVGRSEFEQVAGPYYRLLGTGGHG